MDSATTNFAQRLAANDKKAIRRIRRFLSMKADFSELDLLKLWKGIHYCLWMQDKPLLQEELVSRIGGLVDCLASQQQAFLFLKAFFLTEGREWNAIDIWRLDKFMMLVRQMTRKGLGLVRKADWSEASLREWTALLARVMEPPDGVEVAEGLRFHLADIFLEEAARVVDQEDVAQQAVLALLKAFQPLVCRGKNKVLVKRVLTNVFQPLCAALPTLELGEEAESGPPTLEVATQSLTELLMTWGGYKSCRNRAMLFALVKRMRAAEARVPGRRAVKEEGDGEDITAEDIEQACVYIHSFHDRLAQAKLRHQEKKKLKKKKNADAEGEAVVPNGLHEEEEEEKEEEEEEEKEEEEEEEVPLLTTAAPEETVEEEASEAAEEVEDVPPAKSKKKKKRQRQKKRKLAAKEDPQPKKRRKAEASPAPGAEVVGRGAEASCTGGGVVEVGKGACPSPTAAARGESPLEPGEVEIWVPSKKFAARLKQQQQQQQQTQRRQQKQKRLGEKVERKPAAVQGSPGPSNIYGPLKSVSTPRGDAVRLSRSKSATKSSTPSVGMSSGSTPSSEKKRVNFNLSQNLKINFDKGEAASPQPFSPAFSPSRLPQAGILKASPLATGTPSTRSRKAAAQTQSKTASPAAANTASRQKKTPGRGKRKAAAPAAATAASGSRRAGKAAGGRRMTAADFF